MFNIEKGSQFWLGLFILASSIVYTLSSLGRADWVVWMSVVFGIVLSMFLVSEGGVYSYWKSKGYKRVSANDLIIWVTMFVAGCVFLNSIALIAVVKDYFPLMVLDFLSKIGIATGIIAGILGIVYIFIPKPKA
jgi:hypothetical protein